MAVVKFTDVWVYKTCNKSEWWWNTEKNYELKPRRKNESGRLEVRQTGVNNDTWMAGVWNWRLEDKGGEGRWRIFEAAKAYLGL
jgi:hypothetical protein